jgi:hypothetical protein
VCGEPLVRERTPATEGVSEPVTARLGPFDVLACSQGHQRQYVYADFGNDLRVRTYAALPTARKRVFGGARCRLCGGGLEGATSHVGHFTLALALQQEVRVDLELDMPAVRCSQCHAEQVLLTQELASQVLDAFTDAFDRLELSP